MQAERLEAPEVHFAASSDTYLRVREDKAEHRKRAQATGRCQLEVTGEGRTFERHQEIDRYRIWAQLAESEGDVDELASGLAHSYDHPRARGKPRFGRTSNRASPVVERVGAAYLAIKRS